MTLIAPATTGSLARLRRMRAVAILVFLLLIAFASVISNQTSHEFDRAAESQDLLNRSFETRAQMQRGLSLLQDAETGQRGYIITGDENFLAPYAAAIRQIPSQMLRLGELLADDTAQLQLLDRLRTQTDAKVLEMARAVAARRDQGLESAMGIVASGRGNALMDQIRNVIGSMIEDEVALVSTRLTDSRQRALRARLMVVVALLASLIIAAVASFYVLRHLERRIRVEEALRQQERIVRLRRAVAEDVNSAADLGQALRLTLRRVASGLGAGRGLAVLFDRGTATPFAVARVPDGPDGNDLDDVATGLARNPDHAVSIEGGTGPSGDSRRVLLPVVDQNLTVGALILDRLGGTVDVEEIRETSHSVVRQLGRAAERDRILKVMRETLARHEAVFDSAIDGIVTLNASGSIESFNPAAERLFLYEADKVLRRHFSLLVDASLDRLGQASAGQSALRRTSGGVQEATGRRSDGSTFPAEVALNVMQLDDRRLFLAIIRDASERKRIELMKNEFVSTVSHELRTPLTSIAGSLVLLAGGAAGSLPDRAGRLIAIAHTNSQRLVRLINDILDIEKIESGRMPFEMKPVSLLALVQQSIDSNRGFAESYGVYTRLAPESVDGTVFADTDRLLQVLTNLLSNAIKFSPPGETVDISVVGQGNGFRVTVRDRGPGIPEEFRPRMFTKFAQADSTDTRQKGGTGLGLSIVKEIVARLGGAISFDTAPDWGTAFHVDLPRHAEPAGPVDADAARQRILICQASADAALTIETTLTGAGFDCDSATSATEAKRLASSNGYAAILVDFSLPDQDGIGLIRDLRALPENEAVPIVVVSTDASAAREGITSLTLPVVDWLQKPVDPARLVRAIRDALERSDHERPSILHVDDDPDVLQVVAAAFGPRAHVRSVETLQAAHRALDEQRFDLVILDLGLAEGSGLQLLPRLHQAAGRTVPIVVFSAQDADPELARRVDAILTKSRATLGDLVETVGSLIGRTQSESREAEPTP